MSHVHEMRSDSVSGGGDGGGNDGDWQGGVVLWGGGSGAVVIYRKTFLVRLGLEFLFLFCTKAPDLRADRYLSEGHILYSLRFCFLADLALLELFNPLSQYIVLYFIYFLINLRTTMKVDEK